MRTCPVSASGTSIVAAAACRSCCCTRTPGTPMAGSPIRRVWSPRAIASSPSIGAAGPAARRTRRPAPAWHDRRRPRRAGRLSGTRSLPPGRDRRRRVRRVRLRALAAGAAAQPGRRRQRGRDRGRGDGRGTGAHAIARLSELAARVTRGQPRLHGREPRGPRAMAGNPPSLTAGGPAGAAAADADRRSQSWRRSRHRPFSCRRTRTCRVHRG